ncbi:MAG TPA: hypothetical protein VF540_09095, partial [Segetibacter sp.]
MKRYISIVIAIAFFLSSISAYSQFANLEFAENKGQWDTSVKFKAVINNGAFFLREKGFRVLQSNPEDLEKMSDLFHGVSHATTRNTAAKSVIPSKDKDEITIRSHAYDVEFLNAQTSAFVRDKPLNTYNNYIIGKDPSKWKGNCRIYQAISYQNIYPG